MSFLAAFIHRQFLYEPPVPTASFSGKTVIVTGASGGLGLEACRMLVGLGASQIILACRSVEKGIAAMQDIQASTSCSSDRLQVWHLDMSSYASVQAFSDRVKAELPRLDVLIANAGVHRRAFGLTEDNEETITTNVVALSLLAFLLHPKLHETAVKYDTVAYITVTASELYQVAKFTEREAPTGQIFATLNDETKANMIDRYNVSKLLEIFLIKQMAVLSPISSSKVVVNCVAPGFCHSGLTREYENAIVRIAKTLLARKTEVGARTLVYGASAGSESHGQYVPDCKITPTLGLCQGKEGAELQSRVWDELRQKLEAIRPGVTSLS